MKKTSLIISLLMLGVIFQIKALELKNYGVLVIKTDSLGDTLWTKVYGKGVIKGNFWAVGMDIQETKDSGYMVLGLMTPTEKKDMRLWLLRLDSLGDTLWTKTYAVPQGLYILSQSSDGGYWVVSTFLYNTNTDINLSNSVRLFKFTLNGDILWSKLVTEEKPISITDLYENKEGDFLLTGNKGPKQKTRLWICKIDKDGKILWKKEYGNKTRGFQIMSIDEDKSLVIGKKGDNLQILIIDTEGRLISERHFNKVFSHVNFPFSSAIVTGNDSYFVSQHCSLKTCLKEIDSLGNTLWVDYYEGSQMYLTEPIDCGYLMLGIIGTNTLGLSRLDANGKLLETKPLIDDDANLGHHVKQTSDKGFIIIGTKNLRVD